MEVLLLVFAACLGSGTWGQGQSSYEPEFLDSLENHTVTQGRDVSFTCVVNHLGQYKVAWIKSDSKTILAVHTHLVAHNNRLSVTHNGHNTWKLKVSNVQKNDSGSYMCQINTDPMKSQMGHLEVVIPPDVSDEDGGKDHETNEGGNIRLTCKATGIPEPKVVWRREDGKNIILRHEDQAKNSIRSFEGEMLHLTNVQRSDMGYYLCIASNGVPPTVSKRFNVKVHFHPIVKVSNQLVAAPIGSDVLIQCYVESSPKAMHSWTRENGDKLMGGSKYEISELAVNRYSHFMNLTIKDLTKKDFGSYACSSSNALGKAEGTIRLQELKLPKTTPTPQRKRPPGWKRQTTPRPWRTLEETRRRGEDSQPTSPQPPAAPTTSLSHHPPINESEEGDEENEIDSSASHLSQASLLILVALTLS